MAIDTVPERAAPAPAGLHWQPMSDASGDEFIRCYTRLLPGTPKTLPYILARFQLGKYTDAQFELHAIEFPPNIRNSVPKRQAEFIAGRICAQSVLSAYGYGQHCVAIGAHRQPLWPAGLIGSITHNGQYAAALVCPAAALLGVGIDIETIIGSEGRAAMLGLVVSAEEAACLRSHAGSLGFDCLLTLVFSAKESFFKAAFAHVGEFFDFDAVRVTHVDSTGRTIGLRCVRTLCDQLPDGHLVQARFEFLDSASILTAVLLEREPPGSHGAGL